MSPPVLAIYTEGDAFRGMGHLSRCGGYAEAWRERGGHVRWVVDGDGLARRTLSVVKDEVAWRTWQEDLEPDHADAVLIDSYTVSKAVVAKIAKSSRVTACVDDLFRTVYPGEVTVVHGAPGPLPDSLEGNWLTGPEWHPMRRAFWEGRVRHYESQKVRRCLILAGGVDSRGVIPTLAKAALACLPAVRLDIVGGSTEVWLDHKSADIRVHPHLSAEEMRDLMTASDLAISAAGQTIYELARCGCPAVLVGIAENQRRHIEHWPEVGSAVSAGWWTDPALSEKIERHIRALCSERRRAMSTAGQRVVDGQGCRRLVQLMEHPLG